MLNRDVGLHVPSDNRGLVLVLDLRRLRVRGELYSALLLLEVGSTLHEVLKLCAKPQKATLSPSHQASHQATQLQSHAATKLKSYNATGRTLPS